MAIVFKIAVESGEEGSPLETLPSTAGVPTTLERIRQGLIFSGEFHKISNAQDLLGTDDRALALQRLVQQTPPVWSQPAGQKPAKGLQALPRPSSDCERHLAALEPTAQLVQSGSDFRERHRLHPLTTVSRGQRF